MLASLYKHSSEQPRKILVSFDHNSCTRNGNLLGLLIKTGNACKERMMLQTIVLIFEKFKV